MANSIMSFTDRDGECLFNRVKILVIRFVVTVQGLF